MTANLLTQGTKRRSAQEIADAIDFVGGELKAQAGKDATTITLDVVKKDLNLGLDLMSDVVLHPAFKPEELDRRRLRFAYETRNGDGNPSYLKWAWEVTGRDGGAEVTVTWHAYLKTADRRYFAGPMRRRMLAREVPNSLTAMAGAVVAAGPG